jgi:hypothetical protein
MTIWKLKRSVILKVLPGAEVHVPVAKAAGNAPAAVLGIQTQNRLAKLIKCGISVSEKIEQLTEDFMHRTAFSEFPLPKKLEETFLEGTLLSVKTCRQAHVYYAHSVFPSCLCW